MGLFALGTFAFANTDVSTQTLVSQEDYGCTLERVIDYYDNEGNWEGSEIICVVP